MYRFEFNRIACCEYLLAPLKRCDTCSIGVIFKYNSSIWDRSITFFSFIFFLEEPKQALDTHDIAIYDVALNV